MTDYAKKNEEREAKLQAIRGRRHALGDTFQQLSRMIENPTIAGHGLSSREYEAKREHWLGKREELRVELDGLRNDEDLLLRDAQADLAAQQWESARAMQQEQQQGAARQLQLAEDQQRIADSTKWATWAAVFVALVGGAGSVGTTLYSTRVAREIAATPSPPAVCSPVVQAASAAPTPIEVAVTLDSKLLPTNTTARSRKR
jgi:hypothetical protein